jgi:hypothetical protein
MSRRALMATALASLGAMVALAVFVPGRMVSPGRVMDAHAKVADDCFACHAAFGGAPAAKCIACHKVADIGLRTTGGLVIAGEKKNVAFHQRLVEADCIACHSDHRGVQAFRPISRFSHDLIEAGLRGQCGSCHQKPGDALHLRVDANCSQCHTITAWRPATFAHERYFRFNRDHTTACATCHVDNVYADYTCYGCHEHSRSGIRSEHAEEGIRDYENCVKCHRSGDEHDTDRNGRGSEGSGDAGQQESGEERDDD